MTDRGGIADVEKPDMASEGQPAFTVIYDDTDKEVVDTVGFLSENYVLEKKYQQTKKRKWKPAAPPTGAARAKKRGGRRAPEPKRQGRKRGQTDSPAGLPVKRRDTGTGQGEGTPTLHPSNGLPPQGGQRHGAGSGPTRGIT